MFDFAALPPKNKFDFAALPPERNSAQLYRGPGSAPIWAAAETWSALATALHELALELQAAIRNLQQEYVSQWSIKLWRGALSYQQWLTTTSQRIEGNAAQLRLAAAAYEKARNAMVPAPEVYANKAQTKALQAVNWFGNFTTAIATKQAEYLRIWERNAEAMGAYRDAVFDAMDMAPRFEPAPDVIRKGIVMLGYLPRWDTAG